MAQVVKKDNTLKREFDYYEAQLGKWMKRTGISLALFAIGGFARVFTSGAFPFVILLIPFFGFVIGKYACNHYAHKSDILGSGLEGEWNIKNIITRLLPDNYYGFQNLKVTYEGKTSELDMVVVGRTGVFVIETKNLKGDIEGDYDKQQWVQNKIGQGGTPYSNTFYSPVKQVGTHVYRLANYLRTNGIRVHVEAMVYFSNPETSVRVRGEQKQIPVFAEGNNEGNKVARCILDGDEELSETTVKKIYDLLNK